MEAELPGLPQIIGVQDLVQGGKIIDYRTSAQTPNPERVIVGTSGLEGESEYEKDAIF